MSRKVTVSTFSCAPPGVTADTPAEDVVMTMIGFWKTKLERVLPDRPDLIVLPELCDVPPPPPWPRDKREGYFRVRGTRVQEFFAGVARANRCYIAYASVRDAGDGTRRNSVALLDRSGQVAGVYDKNHVCISEYEEWGLSYGQGVPIMECDFGRVACIICFDLNFEDIRRKVAAARPDLILFSSMYHGGLMQAYWAYLCRAHFVAALHIMRPSAIIAPTGNVLATTTNYFDYATASINLDCGLFHLEGNRPKLEAARAKYGRKLTLYDPGYLAAVLLSCESEDLTIADVVKEFDLEPLDGFFNRALAHRNAHLDNHP